MEFTSNLFFLFALGFFLVYYFLQRLGLSNSVINHYISFSSFLFYAVWYPPAALIVIYLIILTRFGGLFLDSLQGRLKTLFLIFLISVTLLPLLFFKYYNFITIDVLQIRDSLLKVILPVGISFYTFTVIGYYFDIYRNEVPASHSLSHTNLFITFWPHLASGPILRARNIFHNIEEKAKTDISSWYLITVMIMSGFVKKFLIADNIGSYVNWNLRFGVSDMAPLDAWLTLLGFAAQIYADFSGYSDMAIGFALIIGFQLPANFNYPYRSTSLTEFWRRWHISLSLWFRDYVYIPLGGSRVSALRSNINLIIVFFISGIWHGPAYHFIIWGLIHGFVLVLEKIGRKVYFRLHASLRWIITMFVVLISWSYFMMDTSKATALSFKLLDFPSYGSWHNGPPYNSLPILILLFFPVVDHAVQFYRVNDKGFPESNRKLYSLLILLFLFLLALLFKGKELPFIYFQF